MVCAPPLRAAGRPAEQDPGVLRARLRSARLACAIPRGAVGRATIATDEVSRTAPTIPPWIRATSRQRKRPPRLTGAGIEVTIRLRELDGRWLAVAEFGGEPEVGIGATPRAALTAALGTLGERTASALMADPSSSGSAPRSASWPDLRPPTAPMRGLAHPVVAQVAAIPARSIARLVDVDARAWGCRADPEPAPATIADRGERAMLHSAQCGCDILRIAGPMLESPSALDRAFSEHGRMLAQDQIEGRHRIGL